MALILRNVKGSPLTFAEGDANLVYLESLALSGSSGHIDTGSFATTESNTFYGNQIISGSSDFILGIHAKDGGPWAFGIYNDTYNPTQSVLAGWVWDIGKASIGTEVNTPLEIYTNAAYNNPTLIISSSGVTVDNNLTVSGSIYLGSGSIISENSSSTIFTPPGALPGQSLVIRPTAASWSVTSSGYIVYGQPITISVNLLNWAYYGTVNYVITGTGVNSTTLGRATTGKVVFTGISEPDTQTVTWTIPSNSNISEFTFTLTSIDGTYQSGLPGPDPALYYNFEYNALPTGNFVTVTNNNISNSEHSHIHLISGDPTTTDIYLGDDDQYIKIEKNAGNIVIGTNLDTNQWIFDTSGSLNIPGNINGALNLATTGSNQFTGSQDISGSILLNGLHNYIRFPNGSAVGDIQNIMGGYPDPNGAVDLYAPNGAAWVQMNYDNRNYIYLEDTFGAIDLFSGSQGAHWGFNLDGTTQLPLGTFTSQSGQLGQALVSNGAGYISWGTVVSISSFNNWTGSNQSQFAGTSSYALNIPFLKNQSDNVNIISEHQSIFNPTNLIIQSSSIFIIEQNAEYYTLGDLINSGSLIVSGTLIVGEGLISSGPIILASGSGQIL
jgi:hypothetical protein